MENEREGGGREELREGKEEIYIETEIERGLWRFKK